ncbi:MAG: phosphate regulon transcriptional regulatory protein PhoB [Anaerolineaceae bacterium 4572_78]|nr:MAG: phosphate regulon transcriptional regulatory protein PhoB [Anaerolineaceae bacterium 4572_78]RKZ52370.1 MAG: phosphate regulon transcriptional regulatory protein PhoB [Gammaproteobacteria bacterium]
MTHILIVEDEPEIRKMVCFALKNASYETSEAENSEQALRLLVDKRPDLIIVDWMLPDISGIKLIRKIRQREIHQQTPIIMLTARSEEEDKVSGLDAGADDYMTKPVSIRELLARIKALLRRSQGYENILTIDRLQLNETAHTLHIEQQLVNIGYTEFNLLKFFMSHPNRVYSRSQLLDLVWGENVFLEERTVDVHVLRLRKILKTYDADKMIQTVRSIGYRFSADLTNK